MLRRPDVNWMRESRLTIPFGSLERMEGGQTWVFLGRSVES